jgi:hypothetical protein
VTHHPLAKVTFSQRRRAPMTIADGRRSLAKSIPNGADYRCGYAGGHCTDLCVPVGTSRGQSFVASVGPRCSSSAAGSLRCLTSIRLAAGPLIQIRARPFGINWDRPLPAVRVAPQSRPWFHEVRVSHRATGRDHCDRYAGPRPARSSLRSHYAASRGGAKIRR